MRPDCLPARGFARPARMRGARQHAVLRRHPSRTLAAQEGGHLLLDAGRAQHAGLAELDEHRAFRVAGEIARDAHGAQRFGGAILEAGHGIPCGSGGWTVPAALAGHLADRVLDLRDRALDLVLGHVVAGAGRAERDRLDRGVEGAIVHLLGIGEARVVLRVPGHGDDGEIVGFAAGAPVGLGEQLREQRDDVLPLQQARDERGRDPRPEAVAGEDDRVVLAQGKLGADGDHGRDHAPQAAEDLVAVRVPRRLLRRDRPRVDHLLHARVVLRGGDELAGAQDVEPRIPGVRPPGDAVLHDAHHAGRARRFQQVPGERVRDDRAVRRVDHRDQEVRRAPQAVARLLLEEARDLAHRDFRRHLAQRVPAHAVGHHHQEHVLAVAIADAILVALAVTLAAVLEDLEAHREPSGALSAGRTSPAAGSGSPSALSCRGPAARAAAASAARRRSAAGPGS